MDVWLDEVDESDLSFHIRAVMRIPAYCGEGVTLKHIQTFSCKGIVWPIRNCVHSPRVQVGSKIPVLFWSYILLCHVSLSISLPLSISCLTWLLLVHQPMCILVLVFPSLFVRCPLFPWICHVASLLDFIDFWFSAFFSLPAHASCILVPFFFNLQFSKQCIVVRPSYVCGQHVAWKYEKYDCDVDWNAVKMNLWVYFLEGVIPAVNFTKK